ncbi:hypothetical protein ATERTT37_001363 [Aspergillus terreus]
MIRVFGFDSYRAWFTRALAKHAKLCGTLERRFIPAVVSYQAKPEWDTVIATAWLEPWRNRLTTSTYVEPHALGNELKADASPISTSPVVSRTMDPKRWSPTKATWLESALNRPESPRHKRQPSQQASWVKERQSRGSVDLGRVNSFKEVTPVGLMRTAAPGSHGKTSSISGLPDVFGILDASKTKDEPAESMQTSSEETAQTPMDDAIKDKADEKVPGKVDEVVEEKMEGVEENTKETPDEKFGGKLEQNAEEQIGMNGDVTRKRAPSLLVPSPKSVDAPLSSPRDPLLNRPKPQSPVIDFRANLRKREVIKDQSPKEEPEFKNVFGRLRKAEASNYVAPDELKENILKGKAALNATGGPKKSQRIDELKESILKQKDAMKANGGSLRRNTAGENDAPMKVVPEAIAVRQNLTKSSSARSNPSSPSRQEPTTPRDLRDQQAPLTSQEFEQLGNPPSPEVTPVEHGHAQDDLTAAVADPSVTEEATESKEHDMVDISGKPGPEATAETSIMKTPKPVRAPPSESVVQDTTEPAATEGPATKVPQADESLEAISAFFKTFPKSSDRVNIDPQLMLLGKNDNQKIRTLKKQIWEITGDGKRQDLPANQEYILYEGSMYLCVHAFELDGNIRSEAHLWCGDDVPDAAVDDAHSFSRKVAKDNGCKLETIKQGKETARFIQALGGILIIRRGSSSRSSSSAFFMLCGRKHLGQMVFDEVDFSRRNLCSGYPFVISAMFGKLYLWKGKGSSAEEVGAARLISMDLGLTGEFEEVAESDEPDTFFDAFTHDGEKGDYMRSDYWPLKPNHEHFRLRLLRVDHELGQRSGFWLRRSGSSSPIIRPNDTVQEVEPFCQRDITSRGIYVLDAFFEIYV